ncbi:enoyl-CoA hydratase [Nocardioides marmoriginsengisoli]|uniref:Enoyl-CoA hydratase n=1 Tax=Nocardioides marmoriginsengisoli TaxID=661483 RepID=A0A3N0CG99_9ACTN|nr:enoyl-CoA hydratase [Nocardioides marmoriginsengisoli]RNL62468.1 enoyl-CoA hydratase [Nocardioides marmoriginsengisoli]
MTGLVVSDPTTSGGVRRIRLDRPDARNAQSPALLYDLDRALLEAAQDPATKVIVLSGNGPHFSSGHDLRDPSRPEPGSTVGTWGEFEAPGCEGRLAVEEELYLGLCRRWREIPKPTIAQVHGKVMAAGLMLAWVCDLIVAADDTEFLDPVVAFGMPGVEYFLHPWELGPRRAKHMLFTGEPVSARDALALGMVSDVAPVDELEGRVDALAERIGRQPLMALKLAKLSVNAMVDAQGQRAAVDQAFALHQLGHAHNQELFGFPMDPTNLRS